MKFKNKKNIAHQLIIVVDLVLGARCTLLGSRHQCIALTRVSRALGVFLSLFCKIPSKTYCFHHQNVFRFNQMALALPVIATTGASKRDEAMNNLFDTLDTDNSNTLVSGNLLLASWYHEPISPCYSYNQHSILRTRAVGRWGIQGQWRGQQLIPRFIACMQPTPPAPKLLTISQFTQ